jgi:hypothetical protein
MANPQEKIIAKGKELFALKSKKKKLEDQLTQLNKDIERVAVQELGKLMTDAEIEKITIKGKGTVYVSDELFCSVLKDDRPKLYGWLREKGHGALIQDYVFPQTLTAFAKEQLGKGEALPEILKAAYVPTAKTRSGSGKKA